MVISYVSSEIPEMIFFGDLQAKCNILEIQDTILQECRIKPELETIRRKLFFQCHLPSPKAAY